MTAGTVAVRGPRFWARPFAPDPLLAAQADEARAAPGRARGPKAPRQAKARRSRALAAGFSLAAHLGLLAAIFLARVETPAVYEPQLMTLVLMELPPPADPAPTPTPAQASPSKAPKQQNIHRAAPPPPDAEPLPAGPARIPVAGIEVSDADLAGAATAGTGEGAGSGVGAGGGGCDMPRRLQTALRKDHLVQAAVARAHSGRPLMVWNGDWVRHSQQDGAGLAAVREALMWEVGFAPAVCRSQPVHGLVVISMGDTAGAPRVVLGTGTWHWSDLLFSKSGASSAYANR